MPAVGSKMRGKYIAMGFSILGRHSFMNFRNIMANRIHSLPARTIAPCRQLQANNCLIRRTKHWNHVAVLGVRMQSSKIDTNMSELSPYIPEPPPIPEEPINSATSELIQAVVGEPSFASQGLGGWSPVGLIQSGLEYMHIGLDLPWWGTIVVATCIVRVLMFPLVVISQRNAAKMNNNMPMMQRIQEKMSEARRSGNTMEASYCAYQLMEFMKEKQLSPIKNIMVPLAQAPVFMSFFFSLRGMANLPVESMKDGGLYWFTNLTVADPVYGLPIITCITLFATIELGVDGGVRAGNLQLMRYFLRAMPIIIFPFVMNFPAAILCYWTASNFLSLGQVALLRIPKVRDFFHIERLIHHPPDALPMKKKGFKEGVTETWTNSKIAKELEERHRIDEVRFKQAGFGPITKTYSYDPTKQKPPGAGAAMAKPADRK